MTFPSGAYYLVYAAEACALYLAWRQYNRQRPGKPMPQSYLLIVGILLLLQLYGESWRH
ncbi:hypothetical protein J7643_14475 [bacterium]|nr:hypothetical protein [bacterium]